MAMAAAQVLPGQTAPITPTVRRFEIPDMTGKGQWIIQRLLAAYPHLDQQRLYGWLNGIVYSNEYIFLHHEHAVGCAEIVRTFSLAPSPVVQERFVFVEDKENPAHLEAGAEFYVQFQNWGRFKAADTIIVGELTDVPEEMIKKKLGRIMERKQQFAKV